MAYVEPNSTVVLLTATGLSPDYQHTYRFTSQQEQEQFFLQYEWDRFESTSFIRINQNKIKVERNVNNVYPCDYLMIKNIRGSGQDPGSQRWWYCFVTNIEYVNEHTTYISFMVDYLQTFFYRLFLVDDNYPAPPPMYIMRQHTSDALYNNTQPEELDLGGETLYNTYTSWDNLATKPTFNNALNSTGHYRGIWGGWLPCVAIPHKDKTTITNRSGMPSPVQIKPFKYMQNEGGGNDGDALQNYLQGLDGTRQLEIIDMFMYPEALLDVQDSADKIPQRPGYSGKYITQEARKPGKYASQNPWRDNDWTPVNNKLYTYPYCYLVVSNGCGQQRTYRYEYFNRTRDDAQFRIFGTCMPDSEFACVPVEYASLAFSNTIDAVTLGGTPKMPWLTDQYKAYLAQTESSRKVENAQMGIAGAQSFFGGLKGVLTGGLPALIAGVLGGGNTYGSAAGTAAESVIPGAGSYAGAITSDASNSIGAAVSGALNIAGTLAKRQDLKAMADNTNSAATPNAMYLNGTYGFKAYQAHIPVEYARRIDDYFTKYGYAINQWGTPNIFSRPKWNFLQATSMAWDVKIPVAARVAISRILERGITFWDKSQKLGWYSGTNK